MTLTKSRSLLRYIKEANPAWFGNGNKQFFGDISYKAYYGKATGKAYLVRATYAWSDMFDGIRKLHYRINPIDNETRDILPLTDDIFPDIFAAKHWLRNN